MGVTLTITIRCDNESFKEADELPCILNELADTLEDSFTQEPESIPLRDSYGSLVGDATFTNNDTSEAPEREPRSR